MNLVDTSRIQEIFSPDEFGRNRHISVIGVGSVGSRLMMELARQGLNNLHAHDFDILEGKNITSSIYPISYLPTDPKKTISKVQALYDLVKFHTGLSIHMHDETVDGTQQLGEIVFIQTDTMKSRKQIFNAAIKFKRHIKLLIETRMGPMDGRMYVLDPMKPAHVKRWLDASDYDDAAVAAATCGAHTTLGPTASRMAADALIMFYRWAAIEKGNPHKDVLENETHWTGRPLTQKSWVW